MLKLKTDLYVVCALCVRVVYVVCVFCVTDAVSHLHTETTSGSATGNSTSSTGGARITVCSFDLRRWVPSRHCVNRKSEHGDVNVIVSICEVYKLEVSALPEQKGTKRGG